MSFEELQKAWQSQTSVTQVTINADLLLKEVRRNQQQFWATIFWRDAREIGICLILTVYFAFQSWRNHDWTEGLVALTCLGIGVSMLADRFIQQKKTTSHQ